MGRNNSVYVDFTREPRCPVITNKTTGAVVTAAAAQPDVFFARGQYFELSQGVGAVGANTELVSTGLTPGATGWLLPGDNTATDSVEITLGITSGSAVSFVAGTDPAFFMRAVFKMVTRANFTHLYAGFRKLGAYETASTNAEALAAYDDKAWAGIKGSAGVTEYQKSVAASDTEAAGTLAAIANNDLYAIEVDVSAAGVASFKVAKTTPAGATYAQTQTALATVIAALAADATMPSFTMTAGEYVPAIVYGMAGGAAISDLRLVSFECGYQ